jgi:dTDP-4-dehydrorhamnose 3,5-epimerase-like enzyme
MALNAVLVIETDFRDDRGFFVESYHRYATANTESTSNLCRTIIPGRPQCASGIHYQPAQPR